MNNLRKATYKSVKSLNFKGYNTWAKPVKIYDGDTIQFALYIDDNNPKIYRFSVRFAGIDTAEIKSDDPKEVEYGEKAKKRVIELLGNDLVFLRCHNLDKYKRILADVYFDDVCEKSINEILLEEGLAYKYDGGKRIPFKDWYA